jgi:hypothetical protein
MKSRVIANKERYTRKNAQVVTNLQQTCSNAVPTTCQQGVFALLVPSLLTSCQRLVDNLLQGCWAQQTCYKLFQQLVIVPQFNNLSTSCEWQSCSNLITALLYYTITLWFPCLDGLIQTRGNVARVKKSERTRAEGEWFCLLFLTRATFPSVWIRPSKHGNHKVIVL